MNKKILFLLSLIPFLPLSQAALADNFITMCPTSDEVEAARKIAQQEDKSQTITIGEGTYVIPPHMSNDIHKNIEVKLSASYNIPMMTCKYFPKKNPKKDEIYALAVRISPKYKFSSCYLNKKTSDKNDKMFCNTFDLQNCALYCSEVN